MGVCTVAFLVVNIVFGTFCTVEHFFLSVLNKARDTGLSLRITIVS